MNRNLATARSSYLGSPDFLVDMSVVIVNWNTAQLLRACLTTVRENAGTARVEVIVVDNASRDGSAAMVARDFPHVHLLVNARNTGFASATNRGLSHAQGRYLLLLNSDTVALPGALEEMVRYMDTHPRAGALGPRLLNGDRSLQSSMRDFPRLGHDALAILEIYRWPLIGPPMQRYARSAHLYWNDHEHTRCVDWVSGACLMLRRTALHQVGLLDEGYFFFAEEMDLCYRLRQRGWLVVFHAGAEIIHLGGQSAAQVPSARLTWHYAGLLRFYRRHRSLPQQMALRCIIAVAAGAHIAALLLRHRHSPNARPLLTTYAHLLARTVRS